MDNEVVDNLIFSPHPDDESLACGGLIIKNNKSGKKTKVIYLTNGDASRKAAKFYFKKKSKELTSEDYIELGNVRKKEAIAATTKLGIKPEDVIFLGYPDGLLERMYKTTDKIFSPPLEKLNKPYGKAVIDYYKEKYDGSTELVRDAVVDDIASIISTTNPQKIFVPAEFDYHSDHQAAFWFVRDAIKQSQYNNEIFVYLVHGGDDRIWPHPRGKTPEHKIEKIEINGNYLPAHAPWPAWTRLPIELSINELKLEALYCHKSQFVSQSDREYYESFIKSEEIFWQINPIHYPNW